MPGAIWCSTAFICPVYGPCNPKSVNSAIMMSACLLRQRLATSLLASVIPYQIFGSLTAIRLPILLRVDGTRQCSRSIRGQHDRLRRN